ncbi:ABC-2 family transporter protein [Candidatus Woesebacteria bacterium]|nr:ABC-2 family transporter protein [Candidatus Woesebacteria bacterium]
MFKVYKDSVIAGFTQVANYRSEIWLAILAKIFQVFLLVLFWNIISKTSEIRLNLNELIPYFFVANAVQVLVDGEGMRFARLLNDEIRNGTVSSYLLRPINPPFFIYTKFLGSQSLVILIATILTIFAFLFYFQGNLLKILLFILAVLFALLCAFGINLIVGSISFWTTESRGLKHVIAHVVRVFGGSLIPITLFPTNIKFLILLTPFPSFAYIPGVLISSDINFDIIVGVTSSFVWSFILLLLGLWLWKKGVKQYESVGI